MMSPIDVGSGYEIRCGDEFSHNSCTGQVHEIRNFYSCIFKLLYFNVT
jgi:hypothetical protein